VTRIRIGMLVYAVLIEYVRPHLVSACATQQQLVLLQHC
jgi:hypothetical protein